VEEQILLQDPALDAGDALPPSNLPTPVSSFVGRVDELMLLDKAIHEHRLVTVVAPGGAGKTRLAIAAGQHVRGSFPDGVWLVDLAGVSQPDEVIQAVAATLQFVEVPGEEVAAALAKRLSAQRSLLVFDNCEHVVDAAGNMAIKLLEAAPTLKILATSREPLGRPGEFRFPLTGLGMAEETGSSGDAERLFAQRASEVRPDLIHDEDMRPAIASICRHLDGLPLAIELAAARVDTLSPDEIDRHLSDRFSLLSDGRADRPAHQSLQASLDWSYSLLAPAERSAFDYLGIFSGPFGVSAAGAVTESAAEVGAIDRLRRLVNVSLVQVSPQPGSQYRLLETVRMYAMAHLREEGIFDDAARRHDRHYVDQCRSLRGAFFGRDRVSAQAVILAELPEYHAAFDRQLAQRNFGEALEMAWPLCHVWLFTGRRSEAAWRMGEVLDATEGHRTGERADALSVAAFFDMYVQEYERAIRRADEAIDLYRALGDEQGLAYVLARRGHLAFSVGAVPDALDLLQQSLDLCTRIGYDDGSAWPLTLLAQARLWSGDGGIEVQRMFEEGRERFIAMGDAVGQAHANMFLPNCGERTVDRLMRYSLETMDLVERSGADPLVRSGAFHNLAFAVWHSGDRPRAEGLNHLAAKSAIETGMTVNSGMAFLQAAVFAGEQGAAERAAILYGAGDAHFVMQKAPFYEENLRPGAEAATQALGSGRYEELHHKGAEMSIDEATAFLLGA
jgi:predicted ATPase